MWFLLNPPGKAAIHVENVDEFKWLNSSYCPVLRQLESAAMKEYYFKAGHPTTLSSGASNLKYRNPKYLSMLNHLRFYLPQVYPKLDKILFLDDDIVVQKDLTGLWAVNLKGKVNGAVETCGESFHRFDKYLNFTNPHISSNFDPNACGWAYGMNVFDLKEWKKRDITGIYHKWQNMVSPLTLAFVCICVLFPCSMYKHIYAWLITWHKSGVKSASLCFRTGNFILLALLLYTFHVLRLHPFLPFFKLNSLLLVGNTLYSLHPLKFGVALNFQNLQFTPLTIITILMCSLLFGLLHLISR